MLRKDLRNIVSQALQCKGDSGAPILIFVPNNKSFHSINQHKSMKVTSSKTVLTKHFSHQEGPSDWQSPVIPKGVALLSPGHARTSLGT